MSDHDTWNMFLAHAFAARIVAGSEYPVSDAAGDADVLLELSKKWKPEPPATVGQTHTSRTVIDDGVAYPVPTPPQPDNDGWIKWEGGECPVSDGTIVDVQYRDRSRNAGEVASSSSDAEGSACGAFWHNDDSRADIVAYRIVSEAGVTK